VHPARQMSCVSAGCDAIFDGMGKPDLRADATPKPGANPGGNADCVVCANMGLSAGAEFWNSRQDTIA
jgi:hypothetical protein